MPNTPLTWPDHHTQLTITYSDMQTYQQCPRAWWFRSYRQLRPKLRPITGAMPMGSRIHKSLELAEKGLVDTPGEAWHSLVAADRAALLNVGWSTEDLEKEDRLGQKMLEGFSEWEAESGFYATYAVESVEQGLTDMLWFPELPGIRIRMRAKLDRVLVRRSDESRWIGDFKTIGTLSERDLGTLQRSPQPRLYALMLKQHAPPDQWVAGAVYTLLRKVLRTKTANPPFYLALTVPITDWDLEQYRLRTVSLVRRMMNDTKLLVSGKDHRTVVHFAPSWQCQTCPFRNPCFLMQDTSLEAAEEYLADNFEYGDPWERYESID